MPLQLLLRLCVGALSYMSVSWCQRRPAGGLDEVRGVAPPPPGDSGSTWRLAHSPVCLRVTNTTTQVSSLATAWYYRGGRFWFCFCWVVFERFVASFDLILRPFFLLVLDAALDYFYLFFYSGLNCFSTSFMTDFLSWLLTWVVYSSSWLFWTSSSLSFCPFLCKTLFCCVFHDYGCCMTCVWMKPLFLKCFLSCSLSFLSGSWLTGSFYFASTFNNF